MLVLSAASVFLAISIASAYESRPDITPIAWNVTYEVPNASLGSGYYFLADRGTQSLGIYAQDGDLVYWEAVENGFNFRPHVLDGQTIMAYWAGPTPSPTGHGVGDVYMRHNNYTQFAKMTVNGDTKNDFHESRVTRDGTLLSTIYISKKADSSAIEGGSKLGYIFDACFVEQSIPQGVQHFKFCLYDAGVKLEDSFLPISITPLLPATAWDFAHVNAVYKDALGNYLMSCRHMHAAYYISGQTGKILWQLGGKKSNFTGSGTGFGWQHDIKWNLEAGKSSGELAAATKRRVSLFNNAMASATSQLQQTSNGLIIGLDLSAMSATAVSNFTVANLESISATSQGNMQVFADDDIPRPEDATGNALVSFGNQPIIAEFDASGKPLKIVHWATSDASVTYRAYKAPWAGYPVTAPDVAVKSGRLFVSWNGATEVAQWKIVQGDSTQIVDRTGFETNVQLDPGSTQQLQAIALDVAGRELARSEYITVGDRKTNLGAVKGRGTPL